MLIEYNSSVMVPAGWRSVTIKAEVKPITDKRVKVVKVIEIDGDQPCGYTSRTGAKRQTYNAEGVALREVGKIKIISKCTILDK